MNKYGLIIMARDPGAGCGGSSHTGLLCPIHNKDNSAKRTLAMISRLQIPNSSIYFLNAILHGFFDKNSKIYNNPERKHCKNIISEVFALMQPRAVLALGLEALQTTIEIFKKSETMKPKLEDMIQHSFSYEQISGVYIFALPHPAYSAINLSKHGLNESNVWRRVAKEINTVFR